MFKIRFTPEISAGQIMVAVAAIGTVLGVWKDVSVDIALVKQGQATQGKTIDLMQIDIRDMRREARSIAPAPPPDKPMRGG